MNRSPLKRTKVGPFEVKYEAGHSYDETWEATDYYCPACGKQEVWHETSGEDYYVGETHLCLSCEAHFYLPNGASPCSKNWQDDQRVDHIRSLSKRCA